MKSILPSLLLLMLSSHNLEETQAFAFAPSSSRGTIIGESRSCLPKLPTRGRYVGKRSSELCMATEGPPPTVPPVIQRNERGGPSSIRYSDFLKLVDLNRIE